MTGLDRDTSKSPDRTGVCCTGRCAPSQCETITGPSFSSLNKPDQERTPAYRDSSGSESPSGCLLCYFFRRLGGAIWGIPVYELRIEHIHRQLAILCRQRFVKHDYIRYEDVSPFTVRSTGLGFAGVSDWARADSVRSSAAARAARTKHFIGSSFLRPGEAACRGTLAIQARSLAARQSAHAAARYLPRHPLRDHAADPLRRHLRPAHGVSAFKRVISRL